MNHMPTVSRRTDIRDWAKSFVILLAVAWAVLHETSALRMEKMPGSCQREQPDRRLLRLGLITTWQLDHLPDSL